jgi:hypothetical protein
MALSADEREIVSDLIGSIRTLAAHVMTLHLQLGAVRTLLARKGTISDAEVQAAFAELNVVASAQEVLNFTSTDAVSMSCSNGSIGQLSRSSLFSVTTQCMPRRPLHCAPRRGLPRRAAGDGWAMLTGKKFARQPPRRAW